MFKCSLCCPVSKTCGFAGPSLVCAASNLQMCVWSTASAHTHVCSSPCAHVCRVSNHIFLCHGLHDHQASGLNGRISLQRTLHTPSTSGTKSVTKVPLRQHALCTVRRCWSIGRRKPRTPMRTGTIYVRNEWISESNERKWRQNLTVPWRFAIRYASIGGLQGLAKVRMSPGKESPHRPTAYQPHSLDTRSRAYHPRFLSGAGVNFPIGIPLQARAVLLLRERSSKKREVGVHVFRCTHVRSLSESSYAVCPPISRAIFSTSCWRGGPVR